MVALLVMSGCTKVQDVKYYDKGNAVNLSASKTSVTPTQADADNPVVSFSWTDPRYGTDTSNYKFVVEIDTAGRQFAQKVTKVVTGKRSTSFTGRELNAILLGFGFGLNKAHTLDVRVTSSYGNNNEAYQSNVVPLTVTPFADPSTLTASATTVTATLANENEDALTFSWSASFPGYTGKVTYTIQYDSTGKNFARAKDVATDDNALEKKFTKRDINDHALNAGIAGGTAGKVDYRIKATTAQGAIAYSNTVSVTVNTYLPEAPYATLYMVGDLNGWNNGTPWPIFRSETNPFGYTYTGYLPAGHFKFISNPGNWTPMWGNGGGSTTLQFRPTEAAADPATFQITTAGYYTINLDVKALTISIQAYDASGATTYTGADAIGIIGSFNGWGSTDPMTTRPDNPHIWEREHTFTAASSEVKFRIGSGWSMNWGPTEENRPKLWGKGVKDGKNIIVPAGTYRILFNDLTGHYVFIKK